MERKTSQKSYHLWGSVLVEDLLRSLGKVSLYHLKTMKKLYSLPPRRTVSGHLATNEIATIELWYELWYL